jgi:2-dehydropantoate 2-reductase
MTISVIGAGGIGSAIAAYLARAGHCVKLVYKDKNDARLARVQGLSIVGRHNFKTKVDVIEWPAPLPASDLVVVAVKMFDTEEALVVVKHSSVDMVLSVQNGVQKESVIRRIVGEDAVVGAVIQITAVNQGNGQIFHPGITPSYVGELNGRITDRCKVIAQVLTDADIPTEAIDNIGSVEWSKTCQWIATSVLSVMTGWSYSSIFTHRWLLPVFVEIVRECAKVAVADGASIVEVPGLVVSDLVAKSDENAYTDLYAAGKKLESDWKDYRASMLLDVERGSKTEFDDIVGYVYRKSMEHGIKVPALEFAMRQVSRYISSSTQIRGETSA